MPILSFYSSKFFDTCKGSLNIICSLGATIAPANTLYQTTSHTTPPLQTLCSCITTVYLTHSLCNIPDSSTVWLFQNLPSQSASAPPRLHNQAQSIHLRIHCNADGEEGGQRGWHTVRAASRKLQSWPVHFSCKQSSNRMVLWHYRLPAGGTELSDTVRTAAGAILEVCRSNPLLGRPSLLYCRSKFTRQWSTILATLWAASLIYRRTT